MVKVRCVRRHWFLMPRSMLETPAPVPDAPADNVSLEEPLSRWWAG
jgi:hypothetical protein